MYGLQGPARQSGFQQIARPRGLALHLHTLIKQPLWIFYPVHLRWWVKRPNHLRPLAADSTLIELEDLFAYSSLILFSHAQDLRLLTSNHL